MERGFLLTGTTTMKLSAALTRRRQSSSFSAIFCVMAGHEAHIAVSWGGKKPTCQKTACFGGHTESAWS